MHDLGAEALRLEFRAGDDEMMSSRRGIVGFSIFSTCTLAVVGLFQAGILKRLPPHTKLFNSELVHGSRLAFSMPVKAPDAVLGMASYSATACLAAIGTADRVKTARYLPIAMGAKCIIDASLGAWLGVEQWKRFRTFSPWSLAVLAASCASLVLAKREVGAALRNVDPHK